MPEVTTDPAAPPCESPPPADQPAREPLEAPRQRLHQLAESLLQTRNRRLLTEFLQLRRALL
jgi:hypothetical protein